MAHIWKGNRNGQPAAIALLLLAPAAFAWQERASLQVQNGVQYLAISSDSRYLAVASPRHELFLWRVHEAQPIRKLEHQKRIVGLTFSRDGKSVVVVSRDYGGEPSDPCQVEWHDLADGKVTKTKVVPGFVHTLSSDRFAALTVPPRRDRVTIHNLETGEAHRINLEADYEEIAFSTDGSLLGTLDQGKGRVRLWDTQSGKLRTTIEPGSQTYHFFFPTDGKRLFTYRGANLWGWDVETGKCEFKTLTRISHFLPGGEATIWADEGDWVFYSTKTGLDKELSRLKYRTGRWQIDKLVITPDQRLIIGACNDGQIRVWDVPQFRKE